MKSVRMTLIFIVSTLVITICGLFFWIAYTQSKNALGSALDNSLVSLAQTGSKIMDAAARNRVIYLEALTDREFIKSEENTKEEKIDFLQDFVTPSSGLKFLGYADLDGSAVTTLGTVTASVADTEFFQRSIATGKSATSNVWLVGDSAIIIYNTPVRNNDGKIIGVIYSSGDAKSISDLVTDIIIGDGGYFFGVDRTSGDIVFSANYKFVLSGANLEEMGLADPALRLLGVAIGKARAGEVGYTIAYYNDISYIMAYAPCEFNNWASITLVPEAELMAPVYTLRNTMFVLAGILILVGILVAILYSNSILAPLKTIAKALDDVAQGDLVLGDIPHSEQVKISARKDEFGSMGRS